MNEKKTTTIQYMDQTLLTYWSAVTAGLVASHSARRFSPDPDLILVQLRLKDQQQPWLRAEKEKKKENTTGKGTMSRQGLHSDIWL